MIVDQKLFQFSNTIKSEIDVISLFESFKPINCVNPFMEIGLNNKNFRMCIVSVESQLF